MASIISSVTATGLLVSTVQISKPAKTAASTNTNNQKQRAFLVILNSFNDRILPAAHLTEQLVLGPSRLLFRNRFRSQMITPLNTPNDVEFVENKSHTGESNSWSLVGWNFLSSKWALTPYFFQPSQETYASASYVFTASRKQGYYF